MFFIHGKKSKLSGKDLFLDPKRAYGDYKQMVKEEAALPPDQGIDFVSIVTSNFSHVPIATTFLKARWDYLSQTAKSNTRLPAGHSEGFIEAFANIYVEAAKTISDEVAGKRLKKNYDLPTIDDGVLGMAFIDTCVKSSRSNQKWTKFPKV